MTLFELWFSQGICPVVGWLGHMVVGDGAELHGGEGDFRREREG